MAEAEPDVEDVYSSEEEEEDYYSEGDADDDDDDDDDYYSVDNDDDNHSVVDSVTDPLYTPVPFNGDFNRPFGCETALMIRGHRGGVIILDTTDEQAYKPVKGRLSGEDYVCETCNLLWSLGDRDSWLAAERKRTERHSCPGYPTLRGHTGEHRFTKYDLLRLYLRHRLKVRLVLAASKVCFYLSISHLLLFILFYFISLITRHWQGSFSRGSSESTSPI